MSLLDGVIVLSIFAVMGGIIFSKLRKNNPGFKEFTDKFSFELFENIPPEKTSPDKIEQVYNEKRTMM